MSVVATRPVVFRIKRALFDQLNKLTAGYSSFIRLREVVDPTRIGDYSPKNSQIVLTMGDNERITELDLPGNPPAIARNQTFDIRCHCVPSEKDPTPIDEYREVVAAEIVKVVSEANYWWTFGGLSIDAEWGNPRPIESPEQFAGVIVPLVVTYRTDENNPYQVRT